MLLGDQTLSQCRIANRVRHDGLAWGSAAARARTKNIEIRLDTLGAGQVREILEAISLFAIRLATLCNSLS